MSIKENNITFKRREIADIIKNQKEHKQKGLILKSSGLEKDFLECEIETDKEYYTGLLNYKLQRDLIGYNIYENGDIYLGKYKEDKLNGPGFYQYAEKEEDNKIVSKYYWGYRTDGIKNKRGVYLILKEDKKTAKFSDFDNANLDVFIGNFIDDYFKNGVYLKKEEGKYYVYFGEFTKEGKKTGKNAYYYNAELDSVLYGNIDNDIYTEAYYSKFDEEGNVEDISYILYNKDKTIKSVEYNNIANIDIIKKKVYQFRNYIMYEDYFGNAYNKFGETVKFIKSKKKLTDFDDQQSYDKLAKITTSYNKLNLSEELEKLLKVD